MGGMGRRTRMPVRLGNLLAPYEFEWPRQALTPTLSRRTGRGSSENRNSKIENSLSPPYTTLSDGEALLMIDKIFKAYDVRATYPNPLNEEMAWRVGHASGQYLKRSRQGLPSDQRVRNEGTMVVGRDMRPSSRD